MSYQIKSHDSIFIPARIKRLFIFLKKVLISFERDNCREKAASLTYTTTLSLVPVLTIFLVILSSIPSLANTKNQITNWLYSNVLPETGLKITEYLNDFADKSSNLTIIGVLVLFITTVMMLSKIETVFNDIWHVDTSHSGLLSMNIVDISRYWLMITLVPIFLATAFIMSSTVSSLDFLNKQLAGYSIDWQVGLEILSVGMTVIGLSAILWLVPKRKYPLKFALIAGVAIGVVFEVLKSIFGFVVINFTSYQVVYGAFAALPLLLLWIYLSWCLILLGVEISYNLFNSEFSELSNHTETHDLIAALSILKQLNDAQRRGNSLSEKELLSKSSICTLSQWKTIQDKLTDTQLITNDINENWLLKKSLNNVTLLDLMQTFELTLPSSQRTLSKTSFKNSDDTSNFTETLNKLHNFYQQELSISLQTLLEPSDHSEV